MKILVIVESLEAGNFHRGIVNGFLASGHDIRILMGPRNSGMNTIEFEMKLMESFVSFRPDILYVLKGALVSKHVVELLGRHCQTINHQVDDPYEMRTSESLCLAAPYEFVFTTDKSSFPDYRKRGGVLLFGADPIFHRPASHIAKDLDVSFVGSIYPERERFVKAVPGGVKVWGCSNALCVEKGRISHLKMIEIANRSKIVLNFADQPDGFHGLKNRLWETMATGSFVLTQWSYNLADAFKEGVELDSFRTEDELKEKVVYYLKHADAREKIAKAGYERVMCDGKWEDRIKQMLAMVAKK